MRRRKKTMGTSNKNPHQVHGQRTLLAVLRIAALSLLHECLILIHRVAHDANGREPSPWSNYLAPPLLNGCVKSVHSTQT